MSTFMLALAALSVGADTLDGMDIDKSFLPKVGEACVVARPVGPGRWGKVYGCATTEGLVEYHEAILSRDVQRGAAVGLARGVVHPDPGTPARIEAFADVILRRDSGATQAPAVRVRILDGPLVGRLVWIPGPMALRLKPRPAAAGILLKMARNLDAAGKPGAVDWFRRVVAEYPTAPEAVEARARLARGD